MYSGSGSELPVNQKFFNEETHSNTPITQKLLQTELSTTHNKKKLRSLSTLYGKSDGECRNIKILKRARNKSINPVVEVEERLRVAAFTICENINRTEK